MINLLHADFSRLNKSWIYKLCLVSVVFITLTAVLSSTSADNGFPLDSYYFDCGPFLSIIVPVFISLFVGTEYSDGVIRNKIVVGCVRTKIYLSMLLTVTLASFGLVAVWYISGCAGIKTHGLIRQSPREFLMSIIISILFTAVLSALFCLISFCITKKANCAVFAIVVGIVLLMTASFFYNALCIPENSTFVELTNDGIVTYETAPNPDYVKEPMRTVYRTVVNSLPTGQAILLANHGQEDIANYPTMIISSIAELFVLTAVGVAIFRKKDLK